MRIRSIIAALALAPALSFFSARAGEGDSDRRGPPEITPEAGRAIERGLRFLARTQHPDGYWIDAIGRKVNEEYQGSIGPHVGVTALACMAFLANGSLPGRGPYGDNVRRGVDWLMDKVNPDDGFIRHGESRMYEHAFATLLFAEVYGETGDPKLRKKLELAIDCIVQAQNAQGGWRYLPGAKDSDMSIVVTCVMALRAARNVGVYVPKETIRGAIEYVKRSFIPASVNPSLKGGFWYQIFDQPFRLSRTSFALTAAGVTALYGAGEYDAPEVREGLRFLSNPRRRPSPIRMRTSFDYFYAHYYAIQAFYQAGGSLWAEWYPEIRDEIVSGQEPGGYWEDLVGKNYATAMATIILQIPHRYLPIFER
jgi:squalene cyclase